ncbi:MAG: tail fiber domain-containing protein [Bacteroidia bacterium]|nr:tail fiber domain-containing protein [Bacteroidia bacterium]NNK70996.1 hypothetical protein [Flavobacteriaceae bacterium]
MKLKSILLVAILLFVVTMQAQTFQDDFAREKNGDFPSKWDLIKGSAQVGTFEEIKVTYLENGSIITPKIGNNEYLSDNFMLEFDAYFDKITTQFHNDYYKVRFWNGTKHGDYNNRTGSGFYQPLTLYRHGAQIKGNDKVIGPINHTVYNNELKAIEGTWRFIAIQFDRGTLKVFIDGAQILNIPNYKLEPSMISIEGYTLTSGAPRNLTIKNVVLSGIKDGADTSTSGSETENTSVSTNGNDTDSNSNTNDQNSETSTGETTFSGLEALDEGNGIGWRLKGRDPQFYGNIGRNAIDFSANSTPGGDYGATGWSSMAIGNEVLSSGSYSIAMGNQAYSRNTHSITLGFWSSTEGKSSLAIGDNARALKDYSIALGYHASADGKNAAVLGNESKATGLKSFAIGSKVEASGDYSTVMGLNSIAHGHSSFAIGQEVKALGSNTIAIGYKLKANSTNSIALGHFNIGEGNLAFYQETDPLFEIGNGDANAASNAMTVLKNGNVGITEHQPKTKLQITGGTDASLNNGTGFLLIGKELDKNIVFDNNEIIARDSGSASTLYFQRSGGDVHVGGALAHSSDKRLKKDITELSYGLKEILLLKPKSYNWKNRTNTLRSLGLIAQDVQAIIDEIVREGEDADKTLSLNYTGLIPVLVKALQEQQAIIDGQNKKIDHLSSHLALKQDELNGLNSRVKQIESLLNIDN